MYTEEDGRMTIQSKVQDDDSRRVRNYTNTYSLKGNYEQKRKNYYMYPTYNTAEGTIFSTQNLKEKAAGPFQQVLSSLFVLKFYPHIIELLSSILELFSSLY